MHPPPLFVCLFICLLLFEIPISWKLFLWDLFSLCPVFFRVVGNHVLGLALRIDPLFAPCHRLSPSGSTAWPAASVGFRRSCSQVGVSVWCVPLFMGSDNTCQLGWGWFHWISKSFWSLSFQCRCWTYSRSAPPAPSALSHFRFCYIWFTRSALITSHKSRHVMY